ncbi:Fpg/Nei family DNA glycosylase, partial [Xanthomonas citri pv. citri]|nr:Fpg/Nei family DNA glycosylase [Xanthomonas citri pv. citri]
MPEGHVTHRIAGILNDQFSGRVVESSSPQGRFSDSAARIDGRVFDAAEAWGKHMFVG